MIRIEKYKYQMVSIGTMGTQINLRLSESMLANVRDYAEANGYDNVQEFIKETVREKIFEQDISERELKLVKNLFNVSESKNFYGTEKEMFKKLQRK